MRAFTWSAVRILRRLLRGAVPIDGFQWVDGAAATSASGAALGDRPSFKLASGGPKENRIHCSKLASGLR